MTHLQSSHYTVASLLLCYTSLPFYYSQSYTQVDFPVLPLQNPPHHHHDRVRVTSHTMLSLRCPSCMWLFFFPPLLPLICLCTDKRVCSSSLTAKLFFWIRNLSNQSRWRRSKARGSVRRGTARTLLRWPFMSMAAGQLPPVFPTETPPSLLAHTRLQTVTTTFYYHVLL